MMMIGNEIPGPIRNALCETLGVDVDEVTPDANFFSDLGGESIDLLDLTFRLEHLYPIKVRFQELSELWKQDEGGRVTSESLTALQSHWPILRDEELAAVAADGNWQQLLSVDFICRLVEHRLQTSESTEG